jgi:hypothetical protein
MIISVIILLKTTIVVIAPIPLEYPPESANLPVVCRGHGMGRRPA